jgi:hypothetical protein
VNATLKDVYVDAERRLMERFAGETLADIAQDFPSAEIEAASTSCKA